MNTFLIAKIKSPPVREGFGTAVFKYQELERSPLTIFSLRLIVLLFFLLPCSESFCGMGRFNLKSCCFFNSTLFHSIISFRKKVGKKKRKDMFHLFL